MTVVDNLKVVSVKTTETRAGLRPSVCLIIRIGLSDGALFSFNPFYLPHPFRDEGYFFPDRELGPEEAAPSGEPITNGRILRSARCTAIISPN
ncbi:hypothetical protein AGMMS49944_30130 [Spirochaetia bacterium]|nr:hypothetical protein AGMMS49944_30130 [Spirochaetia bacterium]